MNLQNKHRKNRKIENRIILILILCALLLIVGIVALFLKKKKVDDAENDSLSQQNTIENNIQENTPDFKIETKYCSLYYPQQWKEQIEVKYSEEAGYKVEFYGKVEGKEEQQLFNVCFNSDDGDLLGYFDKTEEVVNVSIEMMELTFGEDWTQEEMDQIYSMQEESNYVLDMLEKEEGYVIP